MNERPDWARARPRSTSIALRSLSATVAGLAVTTIAALGAPAALADANGARGHDEKHAAKVVVVKKIVPAGTTGEDVTGAAPAAGWTFSATTATAGVGGLPATSTTGDDGSVAFELTFSDGASRADLTVTETQQPGYELVTQGGANAGCADREQRAVPVTDDDATPGRPGFRIVVGKKTKVICVVYNRPTPPTPPIPPTPPTPPTPPSTPPATPPTTPPATPPAAPPTAPPAPSARTAPAPQGGVRGVTRQGRPRLQVEKLASETTVVAGDTVRFTLVVSNVGRARARGIRVCDELPGDVTVVDRGGGRLVAGSRVCWRIGSLPAGATTRRAIVLRVDRGARGPRILNRVTVRGEGQRRSARRRVGVQRSQRQPSVGGDHVTG
jgi:uncharacterized repeat protein (TIGR01451 family)